MKVLKPAFGLAREEIILGTVVLGGMGALGAVAISTSGLLGGPTDTAIHMLEQVESANLKFFQEYGYWPHEVTDGSATTNVAVLQDRKLATEIYLGGGKGNRPLLDAALDVTDGQTRVLHTAGGGGVVRQAAMDADSDFRYTITLDHLSMEDARKLDEKLDGSFDPENGRLTITYVGEEAVVSYKANPRLSAVTRVSY